MRVIKAGEPEGTAPLWTKARPVEAVDHRLRRLAGEMLQTMARNHGVGLAAPQVGASIRLVVVQGGLVMFNPEIVERHGEVHAKEGCLSLPKFERVVTRAAGVVVKYLDRKGREKVLRADGFLARIVQHEVDHLDGMLIGSPA